MRTLKNGATLLDWETAAKKRVGKRGSAGKLVDIINQLNRDVDGSARDKTTDGKRKKDKKDNTESEGKKKNQENDNKRRPEKKGQEKIKPTEGSRPSFDPLVLGSMATFTGVTIHQSQLDSVDNIVPPNDLSMITDQAATKVTIPLTIPPASSPVPLQGDTAPANVNDSSPGESMVNLLNSDDPVISAISSGLKTVYGEYGYNPIPLLPSRTHETLRDTSKEEETEYLQNNCSIRNEESKSTKSYSLCSRYSLELFNINILCMLAALICKPQTNLILIGYIIFEIFDGPMGQTDSFSMTALY